MGPSSAWQPAVADHWLAECARWGDKLWGTGIYPVGQVESLQSAPANFWPTELREGQESQERVVDPLPASQHNWTAAGLCISGQVLKGTPPQG